MSLTNKEMLNIYETVSTLSNIIKTSYPATDGINGSFFQDRNELNLFLSEIFEYSFETPMQLKAELCKMWQYQNAEYMQQFVNICIVAAFKYRDQAKISPEKQEGISPFIYEF